MAWTTMHFAVGMIAGGAIGMAASALLGRGTRWVPLTMTAGGIWALTPDLPRLFREDFPSLPFASILGSKDLERYLHSVGDLFFLHASLDAQPKEYALHGLILILILYNAALLVQIISPPKPLIAVKTRSRGRHHRRRQTSNHLLTEHVESTETQPPAGPAVIGRIDPTKSTPNPSSADA
ncbi:hypothetical protein [Mucisphaera sp.]|uniref:hypothetical protein n=1 Tax=Mucisphaera sp. TaxID=2913024 RepID=UPI003D11E4D2